MTSRGLTIAAFVAAILMTVSASAEELIERLETGNGAVVEIDRSGKGAVLCLWAMLVTVQVTVEKCGWSRLPVDDAIDRAVTQIDNFIVANSTARVTQHDLERRKEGQLRGVFGETDEEIQFACLVANDQDTPASFAQSLRDAFGSGDLDASVADALSIPREPVMNPCL